MRLFIVLVTLATAQAEIPVFDLLEGLKVVHDEVHMHPDSRPYRSIDGNHQPFPDTVSLYFTALGQQFSFEDTNLMTGFLLENAHVKVNGTQIPLKYKSYNQYHEQGWLTVTLHDDSRFQGVYLVGGDLYYLNTVEELRKETQMQTEEGRELLKKLGASNSDMAILKHDKDASHLTCGNTLSDKYNAPVKEYDQDSQRKLLAFEGTVWDNCWAKTGGIAFAEGEQEIGIHLLANTQLRDEKGAGIAAYGTALIAETNTVYRGQLHIKLVLADFEALAPSAASYNNCEETIGTMLDDLVTYRQGSGYTTKNYGLTAVINSCWAYGTVGLAYVGVLCNRYGTSINSNKASNHFLTFAHELGHNFGGSHSFEDGQGNTGGIMDYGDGFYQGQIQFNTKYRKTQMCQHINTALNSGSNSWCWNGVASGTCGNGVVDGGEACEDTGTGCCSNCQWTAGATCDTDGECCVGCAQSSSCGWCDWTGTGTGYDGLVAQTVNGRTCQKWSEQTPHQHQYASVGDHNYCRNAGNEMSGPWCFTTDLAVQRELCDVGTTDMPKCGGPQPTDPPTPAATAPPTAQCNDSPSNWMDTDGWDCARYETAGWCDGQATKLPESFQNECGGGTEDCAGHANSNGLYAYQACCRCGGGTLGGPECPILRPPTGATTKESCAFKVAGETCTFACGSGYDQGSGSGTRTCQSNDQWSLTPLVCTPETCPALNSPSGAVQKTCPEGVEGDVCTFACPAGSTSNGYEERTCSGGAWGGAELTCAPKVCPPIYVPNGGTGSNCLSKTEGQTCTLGCDAQHTLSGDPTRTCTDGAWTGTPVTCNADGRCPEVSTPEGAIPTSCVDKAIGQTCEFTCDVGYRSDYTPQPGDPATPVMNCVAGTGPQPEWDSAAITCAQINCPTLTSPNNAIGGNCTQKAHGSVCSFQCKTGYRSNNYESRTCVDSVWSGQDLTCTPLQCADLSPPSNTVAGSMACANKYQGQTCTFTCAAGFLQAGDPTRTCVNGAWTGFSLVCTPEDQSYGLVASDWGRCDANCDGGEQVRVVNCLDLKTMVSVAKDLCSDLHPVTERQVCNTQACTQSNWVGYVWEPCSTLCGGGTRYRTVQCEVAGGSGLPVDDKLCAGSRPLTQQPCGEEACVAGTFHWVSGKFSECDVHCGGGSQMRTIVCRDHLGNSALNSDCDAATKPDPERECNMDDCGSFPQWRVCDWELCTAECGGAGGSAGLMSGVRSRLVYCELPSGEIGADVLCSSTGSKPTDLNVGCNPDSCDDFNWMTSVWSHCEAGTRSRTYHCHSADGGNEGNDACPQDRIPSTEESCVVGQCPVIVTPAPTGPVLGGVGRGAVAGFTCLLSVFVLLAL